MANLPSNTSRDADMVAASGMVEECAKRGNFLLDLTLLNLSQVPENIGILDKLQTLRIRFAQVADLSPLAGLKDLSQLEMTFAGDIPSMEFTAKLKHLARVEITTPSQIDLKQVRSCPSLRDLKIRGTGNTASVVNVAELAHLADFRGLDLVNVKCTDFEVIERFSKLERLVLDSLEIESIQWIKKLRLLKALYLSNMSIVEISSLRDLDRLLYFNASNLPVKDIAVLKYLLALNSVTLNNTLVEDLSPLKTLKENQQRRIVSQKLYERRKVGETVGLVHLDLSGSPVSDISALTAFRTLVRVNLSKTKTTSLEPLHSCSNLASLDVSGTKITDLGPKGCFVDLRYLDASDTRIENISALEFTSKLDVINIANTRVSDLRPISKARDCHSILLRNSLIDDLTPILETGADWGGHPASTSYLDFRDTPIALDRNFARLADLAETSLSDCFYNTKAYLERNSKS